MKAAPVLSPWWRLNWFTLCGEDWTSSLWWRLNRFSQWWRRIGSLCGEGRIGSLCGEGNNGSLHGETMFSCVATVPCITSTLQDVWLYRSMLLMIRKVIAYSKHLQLYQDLDLILVQYISYYFQKPHNYKIWQLQQLCRYVYLCIVHNHYQRNESITQPGQRDSLPLTVCGLRWLMQD